MTEAPKGSLGGALRETVSGREEAPAERRPPDDLMFYNRSRVSIVQALLLKPALSASRLSSIAGVDHSSTGWHLKRLLASGVVSRDADGWGAYYTLSRLVHGRETLADIRACHCAGCSELLSLAAKSPGLDIVEAAVRLGESRGTVSRTLRRLSARGLIAARRDGARRRLFVTGRLADLSDMSRRWYRDYRGVLLARLRSEGLDVATDIAQDRSLRLEFRAGGSASVIVVPYQLTF